MRLDRRVRVRLRRVAHSARAVSPEKMRLPRLAWFNVKRALHIPTRADRKFLLEEFGRKLEEGRIGPECHITVANRDDGAGAQATARMAAIAIANRFGLTYVHTPFLRMQVAEGPGPVDIYEPDPAWAATWERVFNLGHGEVSVADCSLPQVGIEEFIADRKWWSTPCLLSAGHFLMVTDRMPDTFADVRQRLREKFFLGSAPRPRTNVVDVCVHLRRGLDIKRDNPDTAHRFVENDIMEKSISMAQSVFKELGLASRVRVFSQADEKELASFRALGCELCLNVSALPTFREFVEADLLIMTKSSFSYGAAILGNGVKLYERFARAPMSEWVLRESDGSFDREQLRARLIARQAS